MCASTLFAQDANIESGLLIERLRQQQNVTQLRALATDQTDKVAGRYALLCAQLIEMRSKVNIARVQQVQQQLRTLPGDHALSALWVMLDAEIQFYDVWATLPIDPSLIVRLGYPTEAQVQQVATVCRELQPALSNAMAQLATYPIGVRTVMQQRCGLLLGMATYLNALTQSAALQQQTLQQAHEALSPFLMSSRDDWQMAPLARWLNVEILLAMGKTDDAAKAAPAESVRDVAKIVEARLLETQHRIDVAEHLLSSLENEAIEQNITMQLLIADNVHRLWLKQGATDKAFGMYLRLLAHTPSAILSEALASRWFMPQVISPTLQAMPDAVLYAIASQMVECAKRFLTPFNRQDCLTLAVSSLIALRNRDSVMQGALADHVQLLWATVKPMYEPDDPQKAIESLSMLTHMAENAADTKLVYEALTAGMSLCEKLLKVQDADVRARALGAYQPLARVLFDRFGTSELADNSRLFDVVAVRLPADEYALALQRLADLPVSHRQYWTAQRYLLGIYRKLTGHADWPTARIASTVIPIRDLAISQLALSNSKQRQPIQQVALEASGMLWQLAAGQKQWDNAAAQLAWLDSTAGNMDAKLLRPWQCRRLLSLQRANKWDAASALATRLLSTDGKPVFAVVLQVLDAMDQQLASQRLSVMGGQLQAVDADLLNTTTQLAQVSVTWATVHVADEQQVLAIKLIWARCLCDAGQMHDALALLGPLTQQFDSEPALGLATAECHFKLALPANYQQAAKMYHKLITRSLPDTNGQYPGWYWQAWARYLDICDLTEQHTDIILSRIQSLEAETPTLGGEPYAPMLRKLALKYATAQPNVK